VLMALLLLLNSLLELLDNLLSIHILLWQQVNHVVVSWINTVSSKILKHLIFPGISLYARDTWVAIEKLFLDNVTSRYMHLKSNFNKLASKGTHSISDYFQYVKSIIDSLEAIECSFL